MASDQRMRCRSEQIAQFRERDWSIMPERIAVCQRPNGQEWKLGSGSFGTVYKVRSGACTMLLAWYRQHSTWLKMQLDLACASWLPSPSRFTPSLLHRPSRRV